MKFMQTRLSIGLVFAIIISGLAPFAASPAKAQSRDRDGSHSYCNRRARDYARNRASGGVIGGAIEGAIGGAIIGGILGGSSGARRGSRAGGTIGAISGGSRQRRDRENLYQLEYDQCMRENRR